MEAAAVSGEAKECVKCGSCLPWCEYHLDIPKMLESANSDFA
jgi:predicted aldo/keto reductase-like oxidoreductase